MISSYPQGRLAEHEERRIKELIERRKKENKIIKEAIQRTEQLLAEKER